MKPLSYLADLCAQIDKTYSVSLQYGAHAGDAPQWLMCLRLPLKAIYLGRVLERGDDTQANISAALSMGADLKRFMAAQGTTLIAE